MHLRPGYKTIRSLFLNLLIALITVRAAALVIALITVRAAALIIALITVLAAVLVTVLITVLTAVLVTASPGISAHAAEQIRRGEHSICIIASQLKPPHLYRILRD